MDVDEVREVDDKLVALAKRLKCPMLTNDYNLNRVAEIQGVTVLNVNELANAVRAGLPARRSDRGASDPGRQRSRPGRGLSGRRHDDRGGRRPPLHRRTINVVVTKVLQTAAGRMIFARPDIRSPQATRTNRAAARQRMGVERLRRTSPVGALAEDLMPIQVYNVLTRQKEDFKPLIEGLVHDVCLRSDGLRLCRTSATPRPTSPST